MSITYRILVVLILFAKNRRAREAADRGRDYENIVRDDSTVGRFAGFGFLATGPGVSLRFTPGFMPSAAPRTHRISS